MIVYSPTIAKVAQTVALLADAGIAAIPYHGKMGAVERRRRTRNAWMADEVRVLVGTIAFGLGINKAAVRAVIHLSLPKSIEQYYQEAGRAGRDGLPADCLLLWTKARFRALASHFIKQISDDAERETVLAALSHDQTIRGKRGVPPLADLRAFRRGSEVGFLWGMRRVPGRGGAAGGDFDRYSCESARGREAARAECDPPSVRRRESPTRATPGVMDSALNEQLRQWRSSTAKEQGVPAFVVMHDTTLEVICVRRPASRSELLEIPGIGERKAERYGRQILDLLARRGRAAKPSDDASSKVRIRGATAGA